jgi:hypothetical protein
MSGTRSSRTRLGRSIRSHARKHVEQGEHATHYGIVRQVAPLHVELTGRGLLLEEDHLIVSQWVRRYGYDFGLNVGDTVLVSHMPNDDFVVHDVVSTAKIETGLDDDTRTAVSLDSRNGEIVAKVPYLLENGTRLGYVPVFGSLHTDPGGVTIPVVVDVD